MPDQSDSIRPIPLAVSIFTMCVFAVPLTSTEAHAEHSQPSSSQTYFASDKTVKKLTNVIEKVTIDGVIPIDADAALEKFDLEYLSDVFAAVADGVAFEPYSGSQRGARGTALAGSGNALDQTLLLASALDGRVHDWRIAKGALDSSNLSALLSTFGLSDPGDYGSTPDNPNGFDPINDAQFRKVSTDHYWLEIQRDDGDEWLALDPTFPHANFGESFAKATRHFELPTAAMKQRVEIKFMQRTADGKTAQLGKISGDVAELALYPIVMVSRGIPQFGAEEGAAPTEPEGDLGTSGGGLIGGGGLFGGGSEKKNVPAKQESVADSTERTIIGTEYRRELTYGGDAPHFLKATNVVDAEPSSNIVREWVEFTLQVPGVADRKLMRDLYDADLDGDSPAIVRRYSIALVAGKVSREMFEGYRAKLDLNQINGARAQLTALKEQPATNELALEIIKLESASALTPHLINLAFAFESDELTDRLAAGAGVNVVRDIPRILITTVATDVTTDGSANTKTTLDLRLDEVRAVPYTGMPTGTTRLFQRARGLQESALEGRLLARFVENPDDIVTTTRIMREAQDQGHRLLLAIPNNRSAINDLPRLPDRILARLNAALDGGHRIILPAGAALIGGVEHWGWWDVDLDSGAFVGVMDGGQHQAMVQYTITSEKIALNDAMGFVIGGIVGSTATLTLYSAKMLAYGQMTPDLIREVAAGIEYLTCVTCPKYEVKVVVALEASTESPCEEKTSKSIGIDGGVSGEISFCESYKRGISCAASLMLGTFEIKDEIKFVAESTFDLGPLSCKK